MSDRNVTNEKAINEEMLEKVDGGFSLHDLLMGKNIEDMEPEQMPTGGRTFTVQSAIATGEQIGPVPEKVDDNKTVGKKSGTRIPKIVFSDKGTSV